MMPATAQRVESQAWHDSIEGAAPFPLEDQVVLPNGKRVRGARARVYSLLRQTAERRVCHRIGQQVGPPGWVPGYYLRRGWSGGNSGDRRARELRTEHGLQIEHRPFSEGAGPASNVELYRLVLGGAGSTQSQEGGETRALARDSFPRGFRQDAAGNGRGAESGAPAPRLRFSSSIGFPGAPLFASGPRRVEVTPGIGGLAPSRTLLAAVVTEGLDATTAQQLYRQELRDRFLDRSNAVTGELADLLRSGGEVVLWAKPEAALALDPFPVLVDVLQRLGAVFLGRLSRS